MPTLRGRMTKPEYIQDTYKLICTSSRKREMDSMVLGRVTYARVENNKIKKTRHLAAGGKLQKNQVEKH